MLWRPFEYCPWTEMPFSCRTALAVLSINPSGETPALSAAIMSPQECRAMASAIWLRTQFPTHTKSTRTGSPMEASGCHKCGILGTSILCDGMLQVARSGKCLRGFAGDFHKIFVNCGVVGKFRMEGACEDLALTHKDRMSFVARKDLYVVADGFENWGANENHFDGLFSQFGPDHVNVARELSTVAVTQR